MAQKFGPGQIVNNTPGWAKWMFRITFTITTAATGYIAATNAIPQESKYEITLLLKLLIDPIVFGVSKMFGVDVKESEEIKPEP